MQKHYVCVGGCQGMSANPASCKTYSCPNYKKEMLECSCIDWRHEKLFENKPTPEPLQK